MVATTDYSPTRILRHSRWDGLLITLSLAHLAVLLLAPSFPVIAIGVWWSSNTIFHNFIHVPFFRSSIWNRVYSIYLSLLLGFPQSMWRERHLAHHSGRARNVGFTPSASAEVSLVLALWGILLLRAPRFFLTVYLPGYVAGLALCYLHGFFEHARGTTSYYGFLYNVVFFNDGYHVEHHLRPGEHWTRLPAQVEPDAKSSRWPPIFRFLEALNLELLERLVVRSKMLQRFVLRTHERALRSFLPTLPDLRRVTIVGGGIFPRTALLMRRLLPEVQITIVDSSAGNLETAKAFLDGGVEFVEELFDPMRPVEADLVVIPLAFVGNRDVLYKNPPARVVLIHDWIWARRAQGVTVSPWLLKRLNIVRQ